MFRFINLLHQSNEPFKALGVLGGLGEGLLILRKLVSTGNHFKGAGEQAHSLREPCQKVKHKFKKSHLKGKASILFVFLKFLLLLGAHAPNHLW